MKDHKASCSRFKRYTADSVPGVCNCGFDVKKSELAKEIDANFFSLDPDGDWRDACKNVAKALLDKYEIKRKR